MNSGSPDLVKSRQRFPSDGEDKHLRASGPADRPEPTQSESLAARTRSENNAQIAKQPCAANKRVKSSLGKPARYISIQLSERSVRRKTMSDSLQHPVTILSTGICLASAGYLLLLSPMFGGGVVTIVVASLSGAAAVGSCWLRYPGTFERNTRELAIRLDIEREQTEQEYLDSLRETLKGGFASISWPEGLDILSQLTNEYEQLQISLSQQRQTDPLSLSTIPALADETYRRGLAVLSDTLELMNIVRTPLKENLEEKIAQVELDIQRMKTDSSRSDWLKLKQDDLTSLKERLASISRLILSIEQLLYQARRCEATLHGSRVELAKIRAGGAKSNLDSIIQVLEERIRQVKEVQEEINKLGY